MHDDTQLTAAWHTLESEITKFQAWADTLSDDDRLEEAWEGGYREWRTLHRAFAEFVSATSCVHWTTEMIHLLLYALARDEDTGYLARMIAQNPENLLCLAEHAVKGVEPYAKYQLAAAIGRLKLRSPRAESILLQFAHDEDDYVRRWGLMSLANIGSPRVLELVSAAWNTWDEHMGAWDEHMRIGVLYALRTINAPQLEDYLAQADLDGREYLVAFANKIRAGEPLD